MLVCTCLGETFTADAFSLLAAVHQASQITEAGVKTLHVCVHNPSLARHINNRAAKNLRDRNVMSSEWDIIEHIYDIVTTFSEFNITSHHQTSDDVLLDLHEQLSQDIQDQRRHRDLRQYHCIQIANSTVPVLMINNVRVSGDYIAALRDCTNKEEIKTYYHSKYGWNTITMASIDWRAHGKAIRQLSQRQQKTITQFIHSWLPTNASHTQQRLGTGRLCPYCKSCEESQHHFLQCQHPKATSNWNAAATNIKNKLQKYNKNIDHRLIKLITTAVSQWRTTSKPEMPNNLPPKFHQLFLAQSTIGWNHIIYGRFANEWQLTLDSRQDGSPSNWVPYCIRIVLQEIFEVWKLRCDHEHGKNQEDTRKRALDRLTPQVERLFDYQNAIDQTDTHLFSKPKEDILLAPTPVIENWIFKTSLRIRDSIRRRRQKEKNTILPIHPFFTNHTSQKPNTKIKRYVNKATPLIPTMITKIFKAIPVIPKQTDNDLRPP
jgi:hypothetical protein